MGHIVERCTALSVVCRHTFVIHADAVQRALHLRHTAVAKTASTLRHSFAPTLLQSGILADAERIEHSLTVLETVVLPLNYASTLAGRVGFEPTNEGVKVPCLYRLATALQCPSAFVHGANNKWANKCALFCSEDNRCTRL